MALKKLRFFMVFLFRKKRPGKNLGSILEHESSMDLYGFEERRDDEVDFFLDPKLQDVAD